MQAKSEINNVTCDLPLSSTFSYNIQTPTHDNTYTHLWLLGIIECIVHELVRATTRAPSFRLAWALNSS